MQNNKINPMFLIAGAVLALLVAAVLIFRQVTAPKETIGNYSKVPPKGAGKGDRGD